MSLLASPACAIAFIEGGPGVPTVLDAPWVADGDDPVLAAFKSNYDILFVDNCGMGSNPTRCNISPYGDIAALRSSRGGSPNHE